MLFADEPIKKLSADTLSRRRFVEQLARAILAWESRDPLVIGINGRWGDGKTSVLFMLKEQLSEQCALTFFDPWYFNSQEELIRIYFEEVFRVVSERLSTSQI